MKLEAKGNGRYRLLTDTYWADFEATADPAAPEGWRINIETTNAVYNLGALENVCRKALLCS